MKICAISDLHGHLPSLPPCDLLVIAGDICPDNSFTMDRGKQQKCAAIQSDWLLDNFTPWLRDQSFVACVYIWGNHDFVGEHPYMLPPIEAPGRTVEYLHGNGKVMDVNGELVHVWGGPWVGNIPMWAFNLPQQALTEKWSWVPPSLDILVTHAPPFGTGDFCRGYGPVGDPGLRQRLADLRVKGLGPKLHFFGHIHEGRGVYGDGAYNVAYVDHTYKPYDLDIVTVEYENEIPVEV